MRLPASGGFFFRLAAASALVAAGTAAVVGLAASRVAERHLVEELAERQEAQAALLADALPAGALAARDAARLEAWAVAAGLRLGERVTVIARDGVVLGDSEVPLEGLPRLENHAGRPEVRALFAGAPPWSTRHSVSTGRDYLYAAAAVPGGVVRVARPLTGVANRVSQLRRALFLAAALALAAALLLAWAAAARVHRPLAALARAADRLAAGDFAARADAGAPGELGRLADLLNALAVRVGGSLAALSADKARLEATLTHMVEGVALVGADGRVEELNPAMEALFGARAEAARGRALSETLRHPPLAALVEAARASGTAESGEVKLFTPAERVFAAHATPVREGDGVTGVVLVLHEITRLRRLEEMRKEFVANVSHELRTPLASIKGFAETLRRGALEDPEVRGEFVRTIEEHADRLAVLVDDLLDLAAIEGRERPFRRETVVLANAARAVIEGLEPVAAGAGVSVSAELPDALTATADRTAVERLLRNLVENAVKYNRPGGAVTVCGSSEGGAVRLAVSDTGIGIPAKDLPRVFERFYRVDKARSRELGGTGLGLSIVKHLAEGMGGGVSAASEEGKGSVFTVTLPA